MLIDNTLFGKVDKVQIAIDRIREFEPPEGYYVAFSGGKDSIVVKDLVKRAGVKFDIHFNLTTVDPPELIYYIRQYHAEVEVHRPKESMWQLIAHKGFPSRRMRYCCGILKEGGGRGRLVVTGVRWAESVRRSKRHMVEQCYNDNSKRYFNPIIDWKDNEVWEYIRENSVPYCNLYDKGFTRLGCIMCPLSGTEQMIKEAKMYPRYANMYKLSAQKAYEYKLSKGNLMPPEWKNGDDMYNWWLYGMASVKENPDQTIIFE